MYITIYIPISYRDMNMVKQSNTVSCWFLCTLTFRVFLCMVNCLTVLTLVTSTLTRNNQTQLLYICTTLTNHARAQSQGRGQSPDHRAGCQDCSGLDGCQHQARGHPGVQGGAQYRAAEERGDKAFRGDPATSGLCLFSSGLIYCTNNTTGWVWSYSPMWPSLKSTGGMSSLITSIISR